MIKDSSMPVKTIFSEFRGFFFNLFRSINLFFPGILLLVVFYLLTVKTLQDRMP